jgi:hypothetical protein
MRVQSKDYGDNSRNQWEKQGVCYGVNSRQQEECIDNMRGGGYDKYL